MMFIDTNMMVAASNQAHPDHAQCLTRFTLAMESRGVRSLHTLSEVYSVLTRLPRPFRFSPREVMFVVDRVFERLQPITLTPREHHAAIQDVASRGISGDAVYDALHMACARKSGATEIYTMNVRHFRMIAPDLADRILLP